MKLFSRYSWTVMMSIVPMTFMFLLLTLPAQANPMYMGISHHGHHGHMFRPHNAAVHFLTMSPQLQLTDKQIQHLITLRDAWIEKNSANEARLTAIRSDLQRLIMTDSINLKAVDQALTKISTLETSLWHAFARQLHGIKTMLSAKQKQKLSEMHHMKMHHTIGMHSMKH